jgi:hypothetical protein
VSITGEVHKYVEMVCDTSRDSLFTDNLQSSVGKAGASQGETGFWSTIQTFLLIK